MKLSMLLKVGTIAAAGFALAACSHSADNGSETQYTTAQNSNGGSAQSYGMNGRSGYQTAQSDASSRYSKHVNALRAPANQTYYFAFDSNNVNPADDRALNIQANYLSTHPQARIRLEGNTDNRGSREYNIGLGWRRDQSVEHYLMQRGVSPKQIQMVSYGKEHPAVAGNSAEAWALNRRVNLVYKG